MELDVQPIEDQVVVALKAAGTGLKTEPCPDDPESFTPSHVRGHLLASWAGADWPPPEALDPRPVRVAFDVQVFTKSLRTKGGHGGAYEAVRLASAELGGLEVGDEDAGLFVLRPDNARYIDRRGGYWVYGFRVIGTRADDLDLGSR